MAENYSALDDEGDVVTFSAQEISSTHVPEKLEYVFGTALSGEIQGNASATRLPTISCKKVKFKAVSSNAGFVYLGGAGVTKVNGTTDVTTGWELDAGEETDWLAVSNLNVFYLICDNAGDDLVYMAFNV